MKSKPTIALTKPPIYETTSNIFKTYLSYFREFRDFAKFTLAKRPSLETEKGIFDPIFSPIYPF